MANENQHGPELPAFSLDSLEHLEQGLPMIRRYAEQTDHKLVGPRVIADLVLGMETLTREIRQLRRSR